MLMINLLGLINAAKVVYNFTGWQNQFVCLFVQCAVLVLFADIDLCNYFLCHS